MLKNVKLRFATGTFFTDILQIVTILSGVAILYYPVIEKLVENWIKNENYSHGFIIPVISGYMIYIRRKEFLNIIKEPSNWGLVLFCLGLVQLIVAKIGTEFFLQSTSLIPLLLGLILFIFGVAYARKFFFPVCYLLFMIPLPAIIWNKIAFPLQLVSSAVTEKAIGIIGIPVLREGNILHLAQTTLEVVDACSGLRSLTTMLALSAALAWFANYASLRKLVMFLSAIPIAVLANILRLVFTAILASLYGSEVAQGFLHDFSGIVIFILGLAMLAGVNVLMTRSIVLQTVVGVE